MPASSHYRSGQIVQLRKDRTHCASVANGFVIFSHSLLGGGAQVFSSHRNNFDIQTGPAEQCRDPRLQIARLGGRTSSGIQNNDHCYRIASAPGGNW
jgi:hypothetical protein